MKQKSFTILLTILMSMAANVAFAYDAEIDGIYYNFNGTEATVTSGDNEYTGDIVIPETVTYNETEYLVVSIGRAAFAYCNGLTSITIPNSVKNIKENAFRECYSLSSITIPNSVTSIEEESFSHCSALTSITIPNSVTSIGSWAFYYCDGLTSITIPNSVKSIGGWVFGGCSSLTSVTIPNSVIRIGNDVFTECTCLTAIVVEEGNSAFDSRNNCNAIIETSSNTLIAGCKNTTIPSSVTSIGFAAFHNCSGLTSITIPNSVTDIVSSAFSGCSALTSITIPSSVTNIDYNAFSACSTLTAILVEDGNSTYDSRNNCNAIIETASNTLIAGCKYTTIPNSVTSIGNYAFSGFSGLTSITIPNSVKDIGHNAFSGCNDLTSITIPDGVTSIKYSTFYFCDGLTSITIPNSVTNIEDGAFNCCFSLTSITIPNRVTSIGNSAFSYCQGLTSITIPNSVTSIGNGAFYACNGLTSIEIPDGQRSIGDKAFSCCYGLKDIYSYAKDVPITASAAFNDTPISDITLHEPAGSIYAYRATAPWSDFKEIVESDYLNVEDLSIVINESNTIDIELYNEDTNLVAFQMDLTLPEGVSLDKAGCYLSSRITDEEQTLTVGKLESGAYRLTSTSYSLTPISGQSDALLTLKLTSSDDCEGGEATISNIRFSTSDSEKVVMSDETFNIEVLKKFNVTYMLDGEVYKSVETVYKTPLTHEAEPTKDGYTFGGWSELPETMPNHDVEVTGRFYLYGDVNTDEEVDVVDVVDIARYVVATPSAYFREKLADMNFDNTVNIADAVTLVNHIAGDQNFVKAEMSSKPFYDYSQCQLQLLNGEDYLSIRLSGEADFTAFQFEVEVPENTNISAMRINGMRNNGHKLLFNKVAENRYRVAAISLTNATFKGEEGELLNICIEGLQTDDACIHGIHFVTTKGLDITFDSLYVSGIETGIVNVDNNGNNPIYDLQGRRRSTLQHGLNIVGGKTILNK